MSENNLSRIYGEVQNINQIEVRELYAKRVGKSKTVHIDSPVVLSGDTDVKNIDLWTQTELEKWLPLVRLDENSIVLELGFGTGRMSKYIIPQVKEYIGLDFVSEFVDIVKQREDIKGKDHATFYHASFSEYLESDSMKKMRFNRFFVLGGVFMYMNDNEAKHCIQGLERLLSEDCIIYISEPVSIDKRLTLKSFYSETIEEEYSAIYRNENEYRELFLPLTDKGFHYSISEEFFENDIKNQKETRQWIFIMTRKERPE